MYKNAIHTNRLYFALLCINIVMYEETRRL